MAKITTGMPLFVYSPKEKLIYGIMSATCTPQPPARMSPACATQQPKTAWQLSDGLIADADEEAFQILTDVVI